MFCSNSENANEREPIIRGAHLVIESDNESFAHIVHSLFSSICFEINTY